MKAHSTGRVVSSVITLDTGVEVPVLPPTIPSQECLDRFAIERCYSTVSMGPTTATGTKNPNIICFFEDGTIKYYAFNGELLCVQWRGNRNKEEDCLSQKLL